MVHGRYAAATPLRPPASRFAHPERFAWEALRLREAAAALRSASSYFGEGAAELLRRTAAPVPLHHPDLPGPPAWGCFTSSPFQLRVAAEAMLGMLFANLFWVGLWDLLDNTIFPSDTNGQMLLLIVAGTVGLYATNALYDPPQEDLLAPASAPAPEEGMRLSRFTFGLGFGSGASLASDDEPGVRLPLTRAGAGDAVPEDEDIRDGPFVPPRLEMRRLGERVVANVAAVLLWTGVWNQIDSLLLPAMCSADGCAQCDSYGEFPCAWYKIAFVAVGLMGLFFTRGLYNDTEVTYRRRSATVAEHCHSCGWSSCAGT